MSKTETASDLLSRLALPAPHAVHDLTMADGAVIRLRRHGNPDGPRLALSHGNGLAIDAYLPFWSLLAPRYDLVLFDMRNHGRNPLHGAEGHDWPHFARDIGEIRAGIAGAFGAKPTAGVFHSLSAIAATVALIERGISWDALVLVDPPFAPRRGHPAEPAHAAYMADMAARARRRPERYRDPRLFAFQLMGSREFRLWVPGAHALFAEATLRPDPAAGDWVLACPRELEARGFETNIDPTLWPRLAGCAAPLKLVGADPGLPGARPTPAVVRDMAAELGLAYEAVPETSHFLQIERPGACVAAVERFLRPLGLGAEPA
jgi:pimeloyl-ACP methyl ester carboxylesterase